MAQGIDPTEMQKGIEKSLKEIVGIMGNSMQGVYRHIEALSRLQAAVNQYAAVTGESPEPIATHYLQVAEYLARTSPITNAEALDDVTDQLMDRIRAVLMGPQGAVVTGRESLGMIAGRQMGKNDLAMVDPFKRRSEQIAKDAAKKWRDNLGKKRGKRRL